MAALGVQRARVRQVGVRISCDEHCAKSSCHEKYLSRPLLHAINKPFDGYQGLASCDLPIAAAVLLVALRNAERASVPQFSEIFCERCFALCALTRDPETAAFIAPINFCF